MTADIIFIHTSDGMHIRHYIDSNNWENISSKEYDIKDKDINDKNINIKDLACNHIIAKQQDVGSANIFSVPSGAKIFIDYLDIVYTTPTLITGIPTGPHTYKLTYPGYIDTDGIIFIESNETYQLSIIMEKITGYLDPKLILYTFGISFLFMAYLSQRKEKKEVTKS